MEKDYENSIRKYLKEHDISMFDALAMVAGGSIIMMQYLNNHDKYWKFRIKKEIDEHESQILNYMVKVLIPFMGLDEKGFFDCYESKIEEATRMMKEFEENEKDEST